MRGKRYPYSGLIFLTIKAEIKNRAIRITALISKNQRYELVSGVIKLINQLPRPITGGYSIELLADRYGKVLVSNPRSVNKAGISL